MEAPNGRERLFRNLALSLIAHQGHIQEDHPSSNQGKGSGHDEKIKIASDKARKIAQGYSHPEADSRDVERYIQGLSLKHALNLSHSISTALTLTYSRLIFSSRQSVLLARKAREIQALRNRERDRQLENSKSGYLARVAAKSREIIVDDPIINDRNVSEMVQLLLSLSRPPDIRTQAHALSVLDPERTSFSSYLSPSDRKVAEKREWQGILLEEPLDGPEWIGEEDQGSELSVWSDSDQDGARNDGVSGDESDDGQDDGSMNTSVASGSNRHLRPISIDMGRDGEDWEENKAERARRLAEVKRNQYWSKDRVDEGEMEEFQAIREVLFSLLGLPSVLFQSTGKGGEGKRFEVVRSALRPALRRYSEPTYHGMLESFARTSTLLSKLRGYTSRLTRTSIKRASKDENEEIGDPDRNSIEAFAETLDQLLNRFGAFCSEWDSDVACWLSRAPRSLHGSEERVTTLLKLHAGVDRETESLRLVSSILEANGGLEEQGASTSEANLKGEPGQEAVLILDSLHSALTFAIESDRHASPRLVADLTECFIAAADPFWKDICYWMTMGIDFDHDRSLRGERRADPSSISGAGVSFSEKNTHARGGSGPTTLATFLLPLSKRVLSAGKSVRLLRSLGVMDTLPIQPCTSLRQVLCSVDENGDDALNRSDPRDLGRSSTAMDVCASDQRTKLRRALFSRISVNQERNHEIRARTCSRMDRLPTEDSAQIPPSATWDAKRHADPVRFKIESRDATSDKGGMRNRKVRDHLASSLLEPSLSRTLESHLSPIMALSRKKLHDVLVAPWNEGGLDLPRHLNSIQDLFLMRQGADMSIWCDAIWKGIEVEGSNLDCGHLNQAFRDVLENDGYDSTSRGARMAWIDVNLVTFLPHLPNDPDRGQTAHQHGQDRHGPNPTTDPTNLNLTLKLLSSVRPLSVVRPSYQVPWPLSHLFTTEVMESYQIMFVHLLQLRRSLSKVKSLLPSSSIRAWSSRTDQGMAKSLEEAAEELGRDREMKIFYALRRKLIWILDTMWTFTSRDVIETRSEMMVQEMGKVSTFDELIEMHARHLERMLELCFLDRRQRPTTLFWNVQDRLANGGGEMIREVVLDLMDLALVVMGCYEAVVEREENGKDGIRIRMDRAEADRVRRRSRRRRERKERQRQRQGERGREKQIDRRWKRMGGSKDDSDDDDDDDQDEGGGGEGEGGNQERRQADRGNPAGENQAEDQNEDGAGLRKTNEGGSARSRRLANSGKFLGKVGGGHSSSSSSSSSSFLSYSGQNVNNATTLTMMMTMTNVMEEEEEEEEQGFERRMRRYEEEFNRSLRTLRQRVEEKVSLSSQGKDGEARELWQNLSYALA